MTSQSPDDTHRKILCIIRDINRDSSEEFSKSTVFELIEKQCGIEGIFYLAMIGFTRLHEDFQYNPQEKINQIIQELEQLRNGLNGN
jgi:hypothetical protein